MTAQKHFLNKRLKYYDQEAESVSEGKGREIPKEMEREGKKQM